MSLIRRAPCPRPNGHCFRFHEEFGCCQCVTCGARLASLRDDEDADTAKIDRSLLDLGTATVEPDGSYI